MSRYGEYTAEDVKSAIEFVHSQLTDDKWTKKKENKLFKEWNESDSNALKKGELNMLKDMKAREFDLGKGKVVIFFCGHGSSKYLNLAMGKYVGSHKDFMYLCPHEYDGSHYRMVITGVNDLNWLDTHLQTRKDEWVTRSVVHEFKNKDGSDNKISMFHGPYYEEDMDGNFVRYMTSVALEQSGYQEHYGAPCFREVNYGNPHFMCIVESIHWDYFGYESAIDIIERAQKERMRDKKIESIK